jgi:murein DD-endopeptidase MepM/ murein hydrolase activator NlpD
MSKKSFLNKITGGIVLILLCASLLTGCKLAEEPGEVAPHLPQPKTLSDPQWIELERTIQAAAEGREDVLAFLLYRVTIDDVILSEDGNTAVVWTALVDKKTGALQSAEPGLVIAHKGADSQWTVVFQADQSFAAELQALPDSMMSAEDKAMYMPGIQGESKDGVIYRGYHLPWPIGQTKYLTGSIGHVYTYKSCPSTCRYAYDFADGTQFAVTAARAGTVKYAVWKYADGNTTNANYIVLEDTTTTPTTYQVYYHFKQNSIPVALRTVGARVTQGQFLGYADDTGYSTGNHLHFMVHANATSSWGSSVDIRFDEVAINGGTPRLCSEAEAYPALGKQCASKYTSQNGDSQPPTGKIVTPAAYTTVATSTINVSGTLTDDSEVTSAQLMYNTGGPWTPIGPVLSGNTFSTDIDLCAADIPDGTFFLSLVVNDSAGKVSAENTALTELTKNYTCPVNPPVCTPGENQVALTSEVDFQGNCQLLEIGQYPNLDALDTVKSDQTSSVQLGSGVSLLLYPEVDYVGKLDFYQASDANLDDNPIGLKAASSARVIAHVNLPAVPVVTVPETATAEDDIQFTWTLAEGAQTMASLTGAGGYSSTTEWMDAGVWHIGTLTAGDYTLTVSAKNLAGSVQTSVDFSVAQPVPAPVAHLNALPEVTNSTAVALSWVVDSGADTIDHFEIRSRIYGETWQDWEKQFGAELRSTIFYGEMGFSYEFQIRAVAANGKALDFPETAETHTYLTNSCLEDAFESTDPGDDEQATATQLIVAEEQTHNFCPSGDVDWLTFQAVTGQELEFSAAPTGTNSAVAMMLFDSDGSTVLGEVHPANANSSSVLAWTAPADGIYFLRLTPQDAKTFGTDAAYTVKFVQASTVNPGTLVCGSVTIPAAVGGAMLLAKKYSEKKKKEAKRPGWR